MLKWIAGAGAGSVITLVAITWVALESEGVVVVHTQDADGQPRSTHVWYVGAREIFLEAGHPDNPWVRDLQHSDTVRLSGEGLDGLYTFRIEPAGHDNIRALMRDKYGWRDVWIGWLFDTTQSQLVRLSSMSNGNAGR